MKLIPASSNSEYRGPAFAWWVLGVLGILDLVRGSIHLFASDGGAGRIAGIDLSQAREVIVFLFAVMGLHQLAFGLVDLAVAMRYRVFLPLLLGVEALKAGIAVVVIWLYKPLPVAAPGKFGTLVAFPILALTFALSLRARGRVDSGPANTR